MLTPEIIELQRRDFFSYWARVTNSPGHPLADLPSCWSPLMAEAERLNLTRLTKEEDALMWKAMTEDFIERYTMEGVLEMMRGCMYCCTEGPNFDPDFDTFDTNLSNLIEILGETEFGWCHTMGFSDHYAYEATLK